MSKHTPGPWKAKKSSGGKYIAISGSASDYFVDLDCEVDSDDKDQEIAEANAALIAAAPDLLAALERATLLLTEIGQTPIPVHEFREVIAKAKGE